MLQCDRTLRVDQTKCAKKAIQSSVRALTRRARVTNVITHASRVKWSQDWPRLISFQKLERERRSFSASLYQFTPGRMAIVQEMMTHCSCRLTSVYVLSDSHCLIQTCLSTKSPEACILNMLMNRCVNVSAYAVCICSFASVWHLLKFICICTKVQQWQRKVISDWSCILRLMALKTSNMFQGTRKWNGVIGDLAKTKCLSRAVCIWKKRK